MNLYLVQHGEAKSESEDPTRPLSDHGVEVARRIAEWGAHAKISVDQIRHSGKKRAEQTAALFADSLQPANGVVATPGLGPKDDVRPVADALNDEEQNIMLVGHLPFLSRLVSQIVTGNPDQRLVRFRNAGVVCLSREAGEWLINWSYIPELAG